MDKRHEVRSRSQSLGCSEPQLRAAVKAVGNSAAKVRVPHAKPLGGLGAPVCCSGGAAASRRGAAHMALNSRGRSASEATAAAGSLCVPARPRDTVAHHLCPDRHA
ncbi:DUF3606 domain-containing protein [Variovorax sp. J31P207]|uniref:DUF3606 domain-containing protein n=1 Tax=Variovorax sp. J31P207 TaxID=3053510 RepID=UPI0033659B2B